MCYQLSPAENALACLWLSCICISHGVHLLQLRSGVATHGAYFGQSRVKFKGVTFRGPYSLACLVGISCSAVLYCIMECIV